MQTKTKYPYLRRFIAFIVDWYICSLLTILPVVYFQTVANGQLTLQNRIDNLPFSQQLMCVAIAIVIFILYYCIFPALKNENGTSGQTIGRKLLKIEVRNVEGGNVSIRHLLMRDLLGVLILQGNLTNVNVYLVSILIFMLRDDGFVPYLQAVNYVIIIVSCILLFLKNHQNLQDIMSGTITCERVTMKSSAQENLRYPQIADQAE